MRKMRKTPGWEQVYIAGTCSQIGPRNTRLLDSGLIEEIEPQKQEGKGRPTRQYRFVKQRFIQTFF